MGLPSTEIVTLAMLAISLMAQPSTIAFVPLSGPAFVAGSSIFSFIGFPAVQFATVIGALSVSVSPVDELAVTSTVCGPSGISVVSIKYDQPTYPSGHPGRLGYATHTSGRGEP